MVKIKIKRLSDKAILPVIAKFGDAGMDFTATRVRETNQFIEYGTDIAVEIPYGYVGLMFPRSSVTKKKMMLKNCVGVIDAGYRGEILARFQDLGTSVADQYQVGDRVVQLIIVPLPQIEIEEVKNLSDSERGEGGYGHTGN